MNNFLDKLQEAWQSQCSKPLDVKPDQLLKVARYERRIYFLVDMFVISVFLCDGVFMLGRPLPDIQKGWPRLISVASAAWVVGYILFNRWRRRRHVAHYDETMLAHVDSSIKDIEHQMWLGRYICWWYILPIALGCMIPPVLFFAMDYIKRPLFDSLMPLLVTEGGFAAVFIGVYLAMEYLGRIALEKQRRELQCFGRFRESLLNTDG